MAADKRINIIVAIFPDKTNRHGEYGKFDKIKII